MTQTRLIRPALTLLIPTYNEVNEIIPALKAIENELGPEMVSRTEIIVADDGTDNLPRVVDDYKSGSNFISINVIRNSPPLGKGKSLALGFEKALGAVVGFLDVDLSTPPRYIRAAYDVISSDLADVFIGSRRAPGSHVTRQQFFVKDILGNALGVIARAIIFSGMRNYQDTQCGFKFYKNAQAKILYRDLAAPDGLNDLEVLIRANLLNLRVFEQGVEWVDVRESKRQLRRILFGEIKAMLRILFKYKIFQNSRKRFLLAWAQDQAELPEPKEI